MIRSYLITASTLLFILNFLLYSDEFDLDSIKTLMRKTAYYGFNTLDGGDMTNIINDWSRGTFMTGVMGTYRITQDQQYIDSTKKWGDIHSWQPNMSLPTHPDNMCCMQTYCEMYIVDPVTDNEYMYLPSKSVIDDRLNRPTDGSDWFWWEDGLYMGPPVIAMIGNITDNTRYFDSLTNIILDCADAYYDETLHLWYWKADWVYPLKTTAAGNPELWGPGNAWVIGGMIRSMKYMPQDYSRRGEWIALFQEFCDALRVKQGEDGFWRTGLYDINEFPDPESSCTSFFTYAFCLGMIYGFLDVETYQPVVRKAWSALVTVVNSEGRVGRCQPWSLAPGGAPEGHNTPEGQGAFMLAAEGIYLIESGSVGIKDPVILSSNAVKKPLRMGMHFLNLSDTRCQTDVPDNAYGIEVYSLLGEKITDQIIVQKNSDINHLLRGQININNIVIVRFLYK